MSTDACFITCLATVIADGRVSQQWTEWGTPGLGVNFVNSTVPASQQGIKGYTVCATRIVGACYAVGETVDGGTWNGFGPSFGGKLGVQGGSTRAVPGWLEPFLCGPICSLG